MSITVTYRNTDNGPQAVCSFSTGERYYRVADSRWVSSSGCPLNADLVPAAEFLHAAQEEEEEEEDEEEDEEDEE